MSPLDRDWTKAFNGARAMTPSKMRFYAALVALGIAVAALVGNVYLLLSLLK